MPTGSWEIRPTGMTTEACGIVCASGAELRPPWEIEGIAIGPYRACAPHLYPNNLRLLLPETDGGRINRLTATTASRCESAESLGHVWPEVYREYGRLPL